MRSRVALAGSALAVAAAIAGCGSSGTGGSTSNGSTANSGGAGVESASLAAITSQVNALTKRPVSIGITTPINGAPPAHKTIAFLVCGVTSCVQIADQAEPFAKALGWTLDKVNIGYTPQTVEAGFTQALNENPDGIIISGGIPREYFKDQLAQAEARHIPVVEVFDTQAPSNGIISVVDGATEDAIIGRDQADYAIMQTHGKLHAFYVNLDAPSTELEWEAFKAEVASKCSGCSATMTQIAASSSENTTATTIANAVQAA